MHTAMLCRLYLVELRSQTEQPDSERRVSVSSEPGINEDELPVDFSNQTTQLRQSRVLT